MNAIRKAILTGLGTGYLPAPGTWGSLIACVVFVGVWCGLRRTTRNFQPRGCCFR